MKLLVTGSNGFVAGSIIEQARLNWEVHGIARSPSLLQRPHVHYHLVDLLEQDKLKDLLLAIKPDALIHTAAMANIDFCEKNPSMAEAVNVQVTQQLASLCATMGIKMVHCSTDTVFDGKKGYYQETDLPSPVNYYGQTKWRSEQIVLKASPKNIVARLALVMGFPVISRGNSFLSDLIDKSKNKQELRYPQNEIRTPIDVVTLGAALIELASMEGFAGIIHLAGNTSINRYDMARQLARTLQFSTEHISGMDSNSIPDRAPRPNDASLDNSKAKRLLKTHMLSLTDGFSLTLNKKWEE
ncbi:MAG: NAD(P)-dependent oxidoreductase [Bacteroidetes bacterium]|nr:NAD(P)-dependent oxidoreductase [Bacteroidota bacterium]